MYVSPQPDQSFCLLGLHKVLGGARMEQETCQNEAPYLDEPLHFNEEIQENPRNLIKSGAVLMPFGSTASTAGALLHRK